MFFTLSHTEDLRFPNHIGLGNWILSCDNGWVNVNSKWRKGYEDNFAELYVDNDRIVLNHDRCRSFPLWWDDENKTLTNLLGTGERIWADQRVSIHHDCLVTETVNPIGEIDLSPITTDDAVDLLLENLQPKFTNLQRTHTGTLPKLFLTGGIDTLLLLALAKSTNTKYEYIDYEHFEYDQFVNNVYTDIQKNYWGYTQIHHWKEPTWLISGCPGDEYLFRGPSAIALWAAWHDVNIVDELTTRTGYHVGYFQRAENIAVFESEWARREEIQQLYPTQYDITKQLLNVLVNDHQHWHLGNTITWTPFKDIELIKIMLRLSKSDMLDQIFDAKINKNIIKKLKPELLDVLSETKNFNTRAKLLNLKEK